MPFFVLSQECSSSLCSSSPVTFFVLAKSIKQGEVAGLLMHGHCYQIYCALYILHPSVSSLPISWPGGWFSPTAPKWLPTACMQWRPLTFTSVVEQRHSHSQQTLPKRERAADTNLRCNKSRFWVKKGWVVVNKRLTCPTSWRL